MEISKGDHFQHLVVDLFQRQPKSKEELQEILNEAIEKWNDAFGDCMPAIGIVSIKGASKETQILKKVFLEFSLKKKKDNVELVVEIHIFRDQILNTIFVPFIFVYYIVCNQVEGCLSGNVIIPFVDFTFGILWIVLKGKRTQLRKFWKDVLPVRESKDYPGIYYDYPTYLEQLTQAIEQRLILETYVERILSLKGKTLSTWELERLPYISMISYPALSRDFLQVLKLRVLHQDLSLQKLAEMMGMSKKTFQKRLNLLIKSYLLQERNYANFEPLGLFVLNLIVSSSNEKTIVSWKDIIKEFPIIYRFTEFRGWGTVLQSKFLLPRNAGTKKYIIEWMKIQKWFSSNPKDPEIVFGVEIPEKRRQFLSVEGLNLETGEWSLTKPSASDGFAVQQDLSINLDIKKKQIVLDLFTKKPDTEIRAKYDVKPATLSNLKRELKVNKILERRWVFAPKEMSPYLVLIDGTSHKYHQFIKYVASRVPVALVNLIGTIPFKTSAEEAKEILDNPRKAKVKIGVANLFLPNNHRRDIINEIRKIDGNAKLITDPLIVPFSPKTEKLVPTENGWKTIQMTQYLNRSIS